MLKPIFAAVAALALTLPAASLAAPLNLDPDRPRERRRCRDRRLRSEERARVRHRRAEQQAARRRSLDAVVAAGDPRRSISRRTAPGRTAWPTARLRRPDRRGGRGQPQDRPGSVVLFDRNGEQAREGDPDRGAPGHAHVHARRAHAARGQRGRAERSLHGGPGGLGHRDRLRPRARQSEGPHRELRRGHARGAGAALRLQQPDARPRTSSPSTSPPTARRRGSRSRRTTRSGCSNVSTATFSKVKGLGFKDHGVAGAGLDASDRDNGLSGSTLPSTAAQLVDRIFARPGVKGMYQPDAVAAFRAGSNTLLVTANEGDARVYPPANIPGEPPRAPSSARRCAIGAIAGLGYTHRGPAAGQYRQRGRSAASRSPSHRPSACRA